MRLQGFPHFRDRLGAMKNKFLPFGFSLYVASFLIGMVSCSKKNADPIPDITLLTFRQDPSRPTTSSDDWIFITDESGNILDSKQFESGQPITLTTSKVLPTKRINVTILHNSKSKTFETNSLNSYLGIPLNQSWVYGKATPFSFPNSVGTATLQVNNFVDPFPSISLRDHFFISSNEGNVGNSFSLASNTLSIPLTLFKQPNRIYANTFRNNVPVYLDLNNITNANFITVDFGIDFKPLDHVFDLDFTGSLLFVGGIMGINNVSSGLDPYYLPGFTHSYINSSTGVGSIKLGYNNGFDLYRTSVTFFTKDFGKSYMKFGSAPSAIPFLNYTNSVASKDYRNFAVSLTGSYQMRSSQWSVNLTASTVWMINSPADGQQILPSFPPEILSKYPSLNLQSLSYDGSNFFVYLDGYTYEDYINTQMNITSSKKPYSTEFQTIYLFNK